MVLRVGLVLVAMSVMVTSCFMSFWIVWQYGLDLSARTEELDRYEIDAASKMATRSGWPPINVYVYPQEDRHTSECLYPDSMPTRYVNENGPWFQRMLEPTVHHQFLHSPIRVDNPNDADVFVIPHYSRMCSGMEGPKRWNEIEDYMRRNGDYFKRYSAVDHFIMHSVPHYGDKPADHAVMWNKGPIIGLLDVKMVKLKAFPWQVARSIIVPFITLKSQDSLQNTRNTKVFVAMSTSTKGLNGKSARLRQVIEEKVRGIPDATVFVINRKHLETLTQAVTSLPFSMSHSQLCIVPPGDAPSSKRFYDAISHYCIPFLLADGFILPYEDIYVDYSRILKQLPAADVGNISQKITAVTDSEIRDMRQNLVPVRERFTWDYKQKPKTGEALWTLSWAIYDRIQMLKPYMNNEMTGWDPDPNFTINV